MVERFIAILRFWDLMEDDPAISKLSVTKVGVWGTTLSNLTMIFATVGDQLSSAITHSPGHVAPTAMLYTSAAHIGMKAMHEVKRWTEKD